MHSLHVEIRVENRVENYVESGVESGVENPVKTAAKPRTTQTPYNPRRHSPSCNVGRSLYFAAFRLKHGATCNAFDWAPPVNALAMRRLAFGLLGVLLTIEQSVMSTNMAVLLRFRALAGHGTALGTLGGHDRLQSKQATCPLPPVKNHHCFRKLEPPIALTAHSMSTNKMPDGTLSNA